MNRGSSGTPDPPLFTLSPKVKPLVLQDRSGAPCRVSLSNGTEGNGTCIGCPNVPCMSYSEDEDHLSVFPDFPSNPDSEVCPTRAISREGGVGPPVIDSSKCVWCGVCVVRCPVGAIWMDPKRGARVDTAGLIGFEPTTSEADNAETQRRFLMTKRVGSILEESDTLVSTFESRLDSILAVDNDLPVRLSRSLLRGAGLMASSRRTGDNNLRMDILYEAGSKYSGVAEVEFSEQAMLESPRAILDDVAVLVSRHHWRLGAFTTLVICLRLPNRRSEYWSVVKDIRRTLNLDLQTLPILSLMFHVWDRRAPAIADSVFYADQDSPSIRKALFEIPLGRALRVSSELGAVVEPRK